MKEKVKDFKEELKKGQERNTKLREIEKETYDKEYMKEATKAAKKRGKERAKQAVGGKSVGILNKADTFIDNIDKAAKDMEQGLNSFNIKIDDKKRKEVFGDSFELT